MCHGQMGTCTETSSRLPSGAHLLLKGNKNMTGLCSRLQTIASTFSFISNSEAVKGVSKGDRGVLSKSQGNRVGSPPVLVGVQGGCPRLHHCTEWASLLVPEIPGRMHSTSLQKDQSGPLSCPDTYRPNTCFGKLNKI